MDIAEGQTAGGKPYPFLAIDRTSKFALTQLIEKADRRTVFELLEHLLEAAPCRIQTVVTEQAVDGAIGSSSAARGVQFADQPQNRNSALSRQMRFDMICEVNGTERRLTKPSHPWRSEDQKSVQWGLLKKSYQAAAGFGRAAQILRIDQSNSIRAHVSLF